jgi:phage-related protein
LPSEICREIGYSLHLAQIEVEDEDSKPMRGFRSADVREITKMDENGTYRAVYTVKFEEIVYVLHVFQKKSKKGIETPKKEIDLIKSRLKDAQQLYKSWKEENEEKAK